MIACVVVSVLLNIVLLLALLFAREARMYFSVVHEDDPRRPARPRFRRWVLIRDEDVSGVSGTGLQCEVAEFSDGHAVIHWINSPYPWTTPAPEGIEALRKIHGHGGKSRLVPIDET